MAVLDDELLQDAELDALVIDFIRCNLPQEVAKKYDDEKLFYIHDLIEDYLAQSDALENEPDEDGYINIEIDAITAFVSSKAKAEKMGDFDEQELTQNIELDLAFGDDFEDDEEG